MRGQDFAPCCYSDWTVTSLPRACDPVHYHNTQVCCDSGQLVMRLMRETVSQTDINIL